MSWSNRLGGLGRFSPFGRPQSGGPTQVSDSDFSYITNDDLRKVQKEQIAQDQHQHHDYDDSRTHSYPSRDTDVLILRNKNTNYTVHFPVHSLDKGDITVGQLREHAAKKTGAETRRIKLLYRGRNLKDNDETCRHAGLRHEAEIMCTIGDAMPSDDNSEDDTEDDGLDGSREEEAGAPKKKRNRGKKSKRRNKKTSGTSTPAESVYLPIPPSGNGTRSSSPWPPVTPVTPLDKLNVLHDKLQTMLPDCLAFTTNPPAEKAKKDFEHKLLSETILAEVLLKLDAVETEGDEQARARRKELVRETQKVLNGLDDAARL